MEMLWLVIDANELIVLLLLHQHHHNKKSSRFKNLDLFSCSSCWLTYFLLLVVVVVA